MVQCDGLAVHWSLLDVLISWSAERIVTNHGNRRETGFCVTESGTEAGGRHSWIQSKDQRGIIGLQQKVELAST